MNRHEVPGVPPQAVLVHSYRVIPRQEGGEVRDGKEAISGMKNRVLPAASCARIFGEGGALLCTYVCTLVQRLCTFVQTYVHKNGLQAPISGSFQRTGLTARRLIDEDG